MARYPWRALVWNVDRLPGTFVTAALLLVSINASQLTGCRQSAGMTASALPSAPGASPSSISAVSVVECKAAPHSNGKNEKFAGGEGVSGLYLIVRLRQIHTS